MDATFAAPHGVPVSRLARVLPGYAFASNGYTGDDDDVRLLRGINVGVGEIRWNDAAFWPRQRVHEAPGFILALGDVVIGMDRPWVGNGLRTARVAETDLSCLLLQRVAKFVPGPAVSREYLYWAYQDSNFRQDIEIELSGLSVLHLAVSRYSATACQHSRLTTKLRSSSDWNGFGAIKAAAQARLKRSVNLLTELKRSLITAAVTGEFDVLSANGSRVATG